MHPIIAEARLKALEHSRPIPWQYTMGNYRFNIDLAKGSRISFYNDMWCFQVYRIPAETDTFSIGREYLGETHHCTEKEAIEQHYYFWRKHQRWVSLLTQWQDEMKMFLAELTK